MKIIPVPPNYLRAGGLPATSYQLTAIARNSWTELKERQVVQLICLLAATQAEIWVQALNP